MKNSWREVKTYDKKVFKVYDIFCNIYRSVNINYMVNS